MAMDNKSRLLQSSNQMEGEDQNYVGDQNEFRGRIFPDSQSDNKNKLRESGEED